MDNGFDISNLKEILGKTVIAVSGSENVKFFKPNAIDRSEPGDICFCVANHPRSNEFIKNSRASVIICGPGKPEGHVAEKCLVHVENPRLAFVKTLAALFSKSAPPHISPSARIHPEAKIGKNVTISEGCVIGRATIGDGSILRPNVIVHDQVFIGRNVHIKSGAVIGGDGFGFEENPDSQWEKFPHVGSVIIEDDVEIGSNTVVDKGALNDTRIGQGSKIDSLVHIAHNVQIGKNSVIVSHVTVGGSTRVGDSVWIALGAMILNGITIGDRAFIGIGANVTQSVPSGHRVLPAFSTVKPPKDKTK